MKYHALFVIFEKAVKFEIVVCCKLMVAFYGLNLGLLNSLNTGNPKWVLWQTVQTQIKCCFLHQGLLFCWDKKVILWESGFELEQYLNIEGFLEKSLKLNLLYKSIV